MRILNAPILLGCWYPSEKARAARDEHLILSLRVDTSLKCNLRCTYYS